MEGSWISLNLISKKGDDHEPHNLLYHDESKEGMFDLRLAMVKPACAVHADRYARAHGIRAAARAFLSTGNTARKPACAIHADGYTIKKTYRAKHCHTAL